MAIVYEPEETGGSQPTSGTDQQENIAHTDGSTQQAHRSWGPAPLRGECSMSLRVGNLARNLCEKHFR
jgi:hypothetical protein